MSGMTYELAAATKSSMSVNMHVLASDDAWQPDVRIPAYEDRFSNTQEKCFCTSVTGGGDELGAYIWGCQSTSRGGRNRWNWLGWVVEDDVCALFHCRVSTRSLDLARSAI